MTMVTTSLTLSWHWFADLVAGLLVGAVLLQLTVAADTALPRTALRQSPRDALRRLSSELPGGYAAAVGTHDADAS